MGRVDLHFANASCAHCARLVSQSLEKVDGVVGVDIDRLNSRLVVDFDPARVSIDTIRSMMEQTGYPTRLLAERSLPLPPRPFSTRAA